MQADELTGLSGKTILITGAGGMLGRAFIDSLANVGDVNVQGRDHAQLDITDRPSVLELAMLNPDIIIHCAADVNAERCEAQPDQCRKVQVDGTQNIADLAVATGTQVLYPQSFLIFDGREIPILENTKPAPMSVYGKCKYEAEQVLLSALPGALVVRMAGFFGGDEKDKNFVGKFVRHLFEMIQAGTKSYEVGDRVWQPTYTLDLASNCLLLLANEKHGLYNMSCHGRASFYELAVACVEELELSAFMQIIQTSEAAVTGDEIAPRPALGIMENRRLIDENLDRQRPWREALAAYLGRPYFQKMKRQLILENA
jgi:dTDP-4-dehydrorhamnose reductase